MGWDESRHELYRFASERIMQFGKDIDHHAFDDVHAVAKRVVSIAMDIVNEVRRRAADDFEQMLEIASETERAKRDRTE